MYKEYYQLHEYPFNITADPDFFFSSPKHLEAFSHLVYGIKERKGILVVTGEIGTGKTTLCRTLLDRLDENVKTALILYPNFSEIQLLKLILKDLGIPNNYRSKYELIDALNNFLIEETIKGNNVVLIVDEAQHLSVKQLEQIRLLSNLETEKEKLLQIILVGQPELCEKLKLTSLRQLNQRIAVRYHILPLERDEIKSYISHRLHIASIKGTPVEVRFTESAIDAIHITSNGTPRMINILCDRALLAAYAAGTNIVDEQIVFRCTQEVGKK